MTDFILMTVINSPQNLFHDIRRNFFAEGALINNTFEQFSTGVEFRDNKEIIQVFIKFKNLDYIWMVQRF